MRPWLPALLTFSIATAGVEPETAPDKKLPGSSLLPDGSQLLGVVIPRHNKERQLVNSLTADVVTLVNDEMIAGSRVTIDFFGNNGARSARIKLREATFQQTEGMLHASEAVTIDSQRYRAQGAGLYFAMRESRGLLTGPTTTWMNSKPQTAMKPKTPALIGAAGVALAAHTGAVADAQENPTPVTVNTTQGPISQSRADAEQALKNSIQASSTTESEIKEFTQRIPLNYEKLTGSKPTPPPNQPLDFKPGPDHTTISCESGMYFDAEKGQLVYLKNVRVDDPQYILAGADVLHIHMAKEEASKKPDKKKNSNKEPDDKSPVPSVGGNFNSVERIIATGAVRILQKAVEKGKQPVEASGALFTFHPDTGDIILSGGYPWVKQGDFFARAMEPNLTLRMKKDGSFVTQGNWQMGGKINQKEDKKNKPQADQP